MAAKSTRRNTRRPARRQPARRPSALVRAARATITPYDRRAVGFVSTRVHRALADTAKTLNITPARARALRVALVAFVMIAALLLTVAGV